MNDSRPPSAPRASDGDVAARVQRTVRDEIRATAAYPVPKSAGMIELHANESPWPLPDDVRGKLAAAVAAVPLNRYPEGAGDAVKAALARALPLPDGAALVLGNGSDELIQVITTAIARPVGLFGLASQTSAGFWRAISATSPSTSSVKSAWRGTDA